MIKNNEKAIQEAAYFIWQNAGCPQGQDEYFWTMALEQVSKCNKSSCSSKSSSACKSSAASTKASSTKKPSVSSKTSSAKKSSK